MGLVFSFLLFSGNRAGCKHRQSVTEARLREPETCPFRCRKKKGNCNLYGRTAVGRGSGGGGHGRGAFSVSATKSWPPPACLSRAKFSFPESSNKKKKGQAAGTTSPPDHHTCEQAAAEPAACRTCACAQCKTCAGRAGRHACLPIAQAQPIRHDANSDSRAAGDRLIDHWSWREALAPWSLCTAPLSLPATPRASSIWSCTE